MAARWFIWPPAHPVKWLHIDLFDPLHILWNGCTLIYLTPEHPVKWLHVDLFDPLHILWNGCTLIYLTPCTSCEMAARWFIWPQNILWNGCTLIYLTPEHPVKWLHGATARAGHWRWNWWLHTLLICQKDHKSVTKSPSLWQRLSVYDKDHQPVRKTTSLWERPYDKDPKSVRKIISVRQRPPSLWLLCVRKTTCTSLKRGQKTSRLRVRVKYGPGHRSASAMDPENPNCAKLLIISLYSSAATCMTTDEIRTVCGHHWPPWSVKSRKGRTINIINMDHLTPPSHCRQQDEKSLLKGAQFFIHWFPIDIQLAPIAITPPTAFSVWITGQHTTYNIQHSTYNIQHSTLPVAEISYHCRWLEAVGIWQAFHMTHLVVILPQSLCTSIMTLTDTNDKWNSKDSTFT